MSMSRQTHTHSDMPVSESEYVRYDDKAWSLLSLEWSGNTAERLTEVCLHRHTTLQAARQAEYFLLMFW